MVLRTHDGGLRDMHDRCSNLEVRRPTAQNFIDLLEATHLIYRPRPSAMARRCCAHATRSISPTRPSGRRTTGPLLLPR